MTKVYFDTQYPINLAPALQLLHDMQSPKLYEIERTKNFADQNISDVVLFLFDRNKKGLDILTEKHFEDGYKIFAFKLNLVDKFDFFRLSLAVMSYWPKFLEIVGNENKPFIITYKYIGSNLTKVK